MMNPKKRNCKLLLTLGIVPGTCPGHRRIINTIMVKILLMVRVFSDARLDELSAMVDYYQAVVSLHQTLGITDVQLNISVHDALASQKYFSDK